MNEECEDSTVTYDLVLPPIWRSTVGYDMSERECDNASNLPVEYSSCYPPLLNLIPGALLDSLLAASVERDDTQRVIVGGGDGS